jgi:glutamate carboxypeptidase
MVTRLLLSHALIVVLSAVFASRVCFAATNPGVLAAAKQCEPQARSLLQTIVQIDSGTSDVSGVSAVASALKAELVRIGADTRSVPASVPNLADNVVATLKGTGKGRILLIAHIDTVFQHGTVASHPYKVVDDHGVGPGAGDDKAGAVAAVCALQALKQIGFRDFKTITLILNSNEETGSVGTRDLIRAEAKQSDVAINLERGVPPDALEVTRKGSAVINIEVKGRAAHAGLEPEKGRNAIIEASHQALQLGSLADPTRETTVNVTLIEGGSAFNAIPEHASVVADVRAFTPEEFSRVEDGLRRLAGQTVVPDIQVTASMTRNFPPWPRASSTDALLARIQRLYAELGRTLEGVAVGSSADIAYAAETGIPSIDGLSLLGGGAHGSDDYADLSSIIPRVYLLTRTLMDFGRNPVIAASR